MEFVSKSHVIVPEARKLMAKDFDNRSSPYYVIQWGDQMPEQSSICNNTCNPIWPDTVFAFETEGSEKLLIELWDDDIIGNQFLGQIEISLHSITKGKVLDQWFDLKESPKRPKDKVTQGIIHVVIYFGCDLPQSYLLTGNSYGQFVYGWKQHLSTMETGDMILYAGSAGLSGAIMAFSGQPFSHCGMVLKMPLVDGGEEELLLIESTLSAHGAKDAFCPGTEGHGVTIFHLEDRLQRYDGPMVWYSKLKKPLAPEKEEAVLDWCWRIHQEKIGFDALQLVGGILVFFGIRKNKEDQSKLFCSELVAQALKFGGEVDESVSPSNCPPSYVEEFSCYEWPAKLVRYRTQI